MNTDTVNFVYEIAKGKQICLDVPIPVKELLEQSCRQIRSQRRQDRRYHELFRGEDVLTATAHPIESIADLVIRKDENERLLTAVEELPERQKRWLRLYYYEGCTYSSIAKKEGVSVSTVTRSTKRALVTLKEMLD